MSHEINDNIIERAHEMIEEFTNHPSKIDQTLLRALERNDLEEVQKITTRLEAQLAQEHFKNYDLGVY